jgi:hypothetical protein
MHREVDALLSAIVADLAERIAEELPVQVRVFETSDSPLSAAPAMSQRVEVHSQHPGPLHRRIQDGMRDMTHATPGSPCMCFLGRNPLYPLPLLSKGIDLLGQEDDVVVIGESHELSGSLSFLAVKNFHPSVFEQSDMWWRGGLPLLQAAVGAEALVMSVRPFRNITNVDDLPYLFHEVEREVLLKQWYPVRTYEALWRMRREHLIPESSA